MFEYVNDRKDLISKLYGKWSAEDIREVIRSLDERTGMNGASISIHLRKSLAMVLPLEHIVLAKIIAGVLFPFPLNTSMAVISMIWLLLMASGMNILIPLWMLWGFRNYSTMKMIMELHGRQPAAFSILISTERIAHGIF